VRRILCLLAVVLAWSAAPTLDARDNPIPQYTIDALARLSPHRVSAEQRTAQAAAAIAIWRSSAAPPAERAAFAAEAARLAHEADDNAAAQEAAATVLAIAEAAPQDRADAALLVALAGFAVDPAQEQTLVAALAGDGGQANALLRTRAARALAIAHMRRDEQPAAQARWREAEAAAPTTAGPYDLELALLGRAASHGYQGQSRDGLEALRQVIDRMGREMATLRPAREMTNAEKIYAVVLAWHAALQVDRRTDLMNVRGYWQVGTASRNEQGMAVCPGDFRLRPEPEGPAGMITQAWSGSSILRLATDGEGRVIHAEVVASVPAQPLFDRATMRYSEQWRYIPDRNMPAEVTPCRLDGEGWLIGWYFRGRNR
jgi:hypothetical protein